MPDETSECRYCGENYERRNHRPKTVCYRCYIERMSYCQTARRLGAEGMAMYRRRYFPEKVLPASVWREPPEVREAYGEIYGEAYRELLPLARTLR